MRRKPHSDHRILRSALRVLLPTHAETHLLRALLYSDDAGRRAWQQWQARVGDPLAAFKTVHREQKGLLPMLHLAVTRNAVDVEDGFASLLRAAHFREELRGHAYRRVLRETASALAADGRPPVVLRGCALADTVYDAPAARHSHGIDLLVEDAGVGRCAEQLPRLGFSPANHLVGGRKAAAIRSWNHACGLPLELHTQLFDVPYYELPMGDLWSRSRPLPSFAPVAGALAPEDALLHVCGHAAHSATRNALRWVCDAWLLIARERALDWPLFLDTAKAAQLALPLSLIMRYLAEELDAPVPAGVCTTLDGLADDVDDVGHEVGVLGALTGAHARMRRVIVTAPGWSARCALLRCLLAPSPACVRALGHGPGRWRLVRYYLARPFEYALRAWSRHKLRPAPIRGRKLAR